MKTGTSLKKTWWKMLSVTVMSIAGLLLQSPSVYGSGQSGPQAESFQTPPLLLKAQQKVQKTLDELDQNLLAAAKELARMELDSPDARSVLARICPDPAHPFLVDCCTVSSKGKMLLVEPAAHKSSEGADISGQEQIVRLHSTKQPVMSRVIPMVEGLDAADLEQPVFSGSGDLLGSVSMLIKPEALLASIIQPIIKGYPVNIWVMETGGRILFDADEGEIGTNLFQDAIYKPFEELLKLGARISAEPAGTGSYAYYQEGSGSPVINKRAAWTTVGLHGAQWRLVLVQKIAGDQVEKTQGPAPDNVLERIGKLCGEAELQDALAKRVKAVALPRFKKFYEENQGLYSVQWVDAKGKNRFGYPPENSLRNYSVRKHRIASDQPFLTALAGRVAATVEQPLGEGGIGIFYLHPIYSGNQYLGMIYAIVKKE